MEQLQSLVVVVSPFYAAYMAGKPSHSLCRESPAEADIDSDGRDAPDALDSLAFLDFLFSVVLSQ